MSWRIVLFHAVLSALIVGGVGAAVLDGEVAKIAVLSLAAAIAGGIPAWLIQRVWADPLRRLTSRVDRLSEGDLDSKVYIGAEGEVRTLAYALNALSERLSARFAQLEGDRRRLAGILSGMIEGVVALDAKQQVVFANNRAGLLLDFPSERAVGKKFWELVRQRSANELVQSAAAANEPRRADVDWQGPTPRSLALYAAPLAGDTSGLIIVVHDVSDLRRLEKLRQEFVANVSHELKTPLAVIKACNETLIDGAIDDAANRLTFLHQIDEQTDRLHALILDLLHLARIEAGTVGFEPAALKLDELAADAVDRHHARAETRHQSLQLEVVPVVAWAEEEAIDVILDNLIDNAIKYTPEGGSITVRCGENGSTTWLEVSDTGVGIPEADLPRIFERFYRVDKARSRELGGTGLGLSIVKHLAQNMGGSVSARSAVGRGSTFTVRIPSAPLSTE